MDNNVIYIGNDHGGFTLKRFIVERFSAKGYKFLDVGTDSTEIVRYPYYAQKVAGAVSQKIADRGILICSTGIGMSIVANKWKGVRASLCTSTYMAKMTRKHNDSNLLCLGGQLTGTLEALDIVDAWLTNEFEGGRHCISLGLIEEVEQKLLAEQSEDSMNLLYPEIVN